MAYVYDGCSLTDRCERTKYVLLENSGIVMTKF